MHEEPPLRPARLVLMDPVSFVAGDGGPFVSTQTTVAKRRCCKEAAVPSSPARWSEATIAARPTDSRDESALSQTFPGPFLEPPCWCRAGLLSARVCRVAPAAFDSRRGWWRSGEFSSSSLRRSRLPFWTVGEALRKAGTRWRWPVQLLLLLLVIRDESNQEVTKRALVPGAPPRR